MPTNLPNFPSLEWPADWRQNYSNDGRLLGNSARDREGNFPAGTKTLTGQMYNDAQKPILAKIHLARSTLDNAYMNGDEARIAASKNDLNNLYNERKEVLANTFRKNTGLGTSGFTNDFATDAAAKDINVASNRQEARSSPNSTSQLQAQQKQQSQQQQQASQQAGMRERPQEQQQQKLRQNDGVAMEQRLEQMKQQAQQRAMQEAQQHNTTPEMQPKVEPEVLPAKTSASLPGKSGLDKSVSIGGAVLDGIGVAQDLKNGDKLGAGFHTAQAGLNVIGTYVPEARGFTTGASTVLGGLNEGAHTLREGGNVAKAAEQTVTGTVKGAAYVAAFHLAQKAAVAGAVALTGVTAEAAAAAAAPVTVAGIASTVIGNAAGQGFALANAEDAAVERKEASQFESKFNTNFPTNNVNHYSQLTKIAEQNGHKPGENITPEQMEKMIDAKQAKLDNQSIGAKVKNFGSWLTNSDSLSQNEKDQTQISAARDELKVYKHSLNHAAAAPQVTSVQTLDAATLAKLQEHAAALKTAKLHDALIPDGTAVAASVTRGGSVQQSQTAQIG